MCEEVGSLKKKKLEGNISFMSVFIRSDRGSIYHLVKLMLETHPVVLM